MVKALSKGHIIAWFAGMLLALAVSQYLPRAHFTTSAWIEGESGDGTVSYQTIQSENLQTNETLSANLNHSKDKVAQHVRVAGFAAVEAVGGGAVQSLDSATNAAKQSVWNVQVGYQGRVYQVVILRKDNSLLSITPI